MLSLLLASTLSVAAPITLAAPGFTCVNVDRAACAAWADRFAERLAQERVFVRSPTEVRQALGAEAQAKAVACDDVPDCVAGVGRQLGVDGVLTGSVQLSEGIYFVTAQVLRSRDGSVWTRASADRLVSETAVQSFLHGAAADFYGALLDSQSSPAGARIAPGVVGLVVGLGGGGLLWWSQSDRAAAADPSLPAAEAQARTDRARVTQGAGIAAVALGGALVLTSVVWNLLTPDAPGHAGLVPVEGGAVAVVGARF